MRHGSAARPSRPTLILCALAFVLGWCASRWLAPSAPGLDANIDAGNAPPPPSSLPPSLLPLPPRPLPFNMEGFSHLTGPVAQTETRKILVAIFAGGHAQATVRSYFAKLPSSDYTVMLFLYDNSSWVTEEIYASAITIHASRQMKWWFAKRYLHPSVVAAYRALVLVDDDVEWPFALTDVTALMVKHGVGIAQPARSPDERRESLSYRLTKAHADADLRLTDFVECGPLTVVRSEAWACVWEAVDGACASGWGLDMVWCRWAAENCRLGDRACAVLDRFVMVHRDARATRAEANYDPQQEWEYYNEKYAQWHARMRVISSLPRT